MSHSQQPTQQSTQQQPTQQSTQQSTQQQPNQSHTRGIDTEFMRRLIALQYPGARSRHKFVQPRDGYFCATCGYTDTDQIHTD